MNYKVFFTTLNQPDGVQISEIEKKVGYNLPIDYIEFLKNINGGKLEDNYLEFTYENGFESSESITEFLSVSELFDLCEYWRDNEPYNVIFIASTGEDNGLVIFLDQVKKGIYLFSGDFGFAKVAESIQDLFNKIIFIDE